MTTEVSRSPEHPIADFFIKRWSPRSFSGAPLDQNTLFRLFEAGGVKGTGKGTLAGSWALTRPGQPPVTIDIKPAKSVHPFTRGFFRRLRCPAQATAASAVAAGGMP